MGKQQHMSKGIYRSVFILLLLWGTAGHAQKPVFNHAAIHVTDLQKSVAFYKDLVGLDTIPDPFRDGKHAWFSLGPGLSLHVIAGATATGNRDMDHHLCLRIPSVESFIPRLEKAGVPYVNARGEKKTITVRPDGVKQIYFQDPDGYWIEINDARN